MVSRVIGIYKRNLDKLLKDLIIYEGVIKGWKEKHPEYHIDLLIEIGKGELYTLSIRCKKS